MWNHNTDEFSDLIGSDAIIIASPQDTHVEYIQRILSESRESYIFCESQWKLSCCHEAMKIVNKCALLDLPSVQRGSGGSLYD